MDLRLQQGLRTCYPSVTIYTSMNFEILTPRIREMVTLNYFVNSVEVWSHTPLGMSCDIIKILVINHKGYGVFLSTFFKHRWCNFEVIHKFVPKSKMYSLCLEHCTCCIFSSFSSSVRMPLWYPPPLAIITIIAHVQLACWGVCSRIL